MPQIEIDGDLLDLQRRSKSDVYKSELVSRFVNMLHIAEELFGPRDLCYTILDIEFGGKNPGIQYPSKNHPHIIIRLSAQAATCMRWACWNLAHETVHLLAPTGCKDATNLEEGVACYFADYYMQEILSQPSFPLGENDSHYKCALKAVKPLFDKDKCFVRKLRKRQPSFQGITKEDIIKQFPELESKDVDFLIENFYKDSDG